MEVEEVLVVAKKKDQEKENRVRAVISSFFHEENRVRAAISSFFHEEGEEEETAEDEEERKSSFFQEVR